MEMIIGALALYAVGVFLGIVIEVISDKAINGSDEQKTWERIEKWRG
jgi:hypothetical protein